MAAARCSACHQPIVGGRFKIDREFAFHPGCLHLPVRIETELATARQAAVTAGATITDLTARRAEFRSRTETESRVAKLAHDDTKRELALVREELAASQATTRRLEADLVAQRTPAPVKADPGADLDDASRIRFGLLELK